LDREGHQRIAGVDDLAVDGRRRDAELARIDGGERGNVVGDLALAELGPDVRSDLIDDGL